MFAAMSLGSDGVQIGSRFAASQESSAHLNFKKAIVQANDGDTKLALKQLVPVRLIKNEFYKKVEEAEKQGVSKETLRNLLGRGRAKSGMFEGDISGGELEIGQVSSLIHSIKPVAEIIRDIKNEFNTTTQKICDRVFLL